jgi:hypothetical protein
LDRALRILLNTRSAIPSLCLLILLTAPALLWQSNAEAGDAKIQVCHVPANTANFHVITISASAVDAHVAHGDFVGPCDTHCEMLCADNDPCTIDECDPGGGCIEPRSPVDCDDGDLCTTGSCNPVSGCETSPVTCEAPDVCTLSMCVAGDCVDAPLVCLGGAICDINAGGCPGCPQECSDAIQAWGDHFANSSDVHETGGFDIQLCLPIGGFLSAAVVWQYSSPHIDSLNITETSSFPDLENQCGPIVVEDQEILGPLILNDTSEVAACLLEAAPIVEAAIGEECDVGSLP